MAPDVNTDAVAVAATPVVLVTTAVGLCRVPLTYCVGSPWRAHEDDAAVGGSGRAGEGSNAVGRARSCVQASLKPEESAQHRSSAAKTGPFVVMPGFVCCNSSFDGPTDNETQAAIVSLFT